MKNLKITAPEGYEIDKEKSTFENIVFKPIKKELPKSWEELKDLSGYYVKGDCSIKESDAFIRGLAMKNFATKEQAEASLALAQLSQLREVYRDGWESNYRGVGQIKYVIYFERDRILANTSYNLHCFLSFQSAKVRDLFLENFRDLIEQAKPLMS